ncbi:hypothetical protein PENTCL1PPCAC_2270 [Pristionchus entomophagus]|uniref:MICOS complex subunit MIC60 n=1 Tax=Pristionchus entomophagus TaxID=358040 RepID=A0AAV5SCG1_9BILA|nr:hypothetical protein PENTCL1PPCAC_2270 [Pristionchus entomophagus]
MFGAHRMLRLRAIQQVRHASTGSGGSVKVGRILAGTLVAVGSGSGALIYFLDIPIGESIDSVLPKGWQIFHKTAPAIERKHVILPLEPRPLKPFPDSDPVESKKDDDNKKVEPKKENPVKSIPVPKKATLEEREESIKCALICAEKRVKTATQAKALSMDAIDEHIKTLRNAIQGGLSGDWDSVRNANERVANCRAEDKAEENDARNYIDMLKGVLKESSPHLNGHPIIRSALSSAAKLEKELDEMAYSIKMVESEQIFSLEYADLVQSARGRFADELRAVLPSFDWDGESKMKKVQLNALLTHAHLRLDQLRRELIESKLREESKLESALKAEMAKREGEKKMSVDNEAELVRRLKIVEEEHNKRLDQMVRAQRELSKIEKTQEIQEALMAERQKHSHKLAVAQSKVDGIEEALKKRVVLDEENRRSKQTWLACYELIESIEYGVKGGKTMEKRKRPIGEQLKRLQEVSEGDKYVSTIVSTISERAKKEGEFTREDLDTRFEKVYRVARRVSFVPESGSTIWEYFISWIRSTITLSFPINDNQSIDWISMDNVLLLDSARSLVKKKKYLEAAKLMELLKGEARLVASSWSSDIRSLEESLFLVRLLTAHSSLQSIRSTY